MPGHSGRQIEGSHIHAVEQAAHPRRFPHSRNQRVRNGNENEGREKDAKSCEKGPRYAAKDITDECGRCCQARNPILFPP